MLVIRLQSSIQNDCYCLVRAVIIEFAWLQQRLAHIFKSVFRVATGHEERGAMGGIQFARRRIIRFDRQMLFNPLVRHEDVYTSQIVPFRIERAFLRREMVAAAEQATAPWRRRVPHTVHPLLRERRALQHLSFII